jgi:hypothetical protein
LSYQESEAAVAASPAPLQPVAGCATGERPCRPDEYFGAGAQGAVDDSGPTSELTRSQQLAPVAAGPHETRPFAHPPTLRAAGSAVDVVAETDSENMWPWDDSVLLAIDQAAWVALVRGECENTA